MNDSQDHDADRPAAYSSPACLLHEAGAAPPPPPDGSDWQEVRIWRKAKRRALLERRLALPAERRAAHHAAVTERLRSLLADSAGLRIGFYWPFKGEYDPRPLARALHAGGRRLALPVVVEKAAPLQFRPWWPGAPMAPGIWSIPVPAAGEAVAPDLLLVPLLGFDPQRFRLGYGGGYYDRTLAALPARPRCIGIGFDLARLPTIHPQPHDIPMDAVVTESGGA